MVARARGKKFSGCTLHKVTSERTDMKTFTQWAEAKQLDLTIADIDTAPEPGQPGGPEPNAA